MARRAAVVLAAGRGTRMGSERPKVLHELRGRPLLHWVIDAIRPVVERTIVVVGHGGDEVAAAARARQPDARIAWQPTQEGTGHALACAVPELDGCDEVAVLAGDVPLVRGETIEALFDARAGASAGAAVLTFRPQEPAGYGRIVRDAAGDVASIVEHRDASQQQRAIGECNSGTWALEASSCLPLLDELPRAPNGERYLTDVAALLRERGRRVVAVEAGERECAGVNSPEQLAALEAELG